MKKVYVHLLLTTIVLISTKVNAQLAANFSATPLSGCAPLVVNFTDNSTGNPTSWNWDLGNGTLSSLQNPSTTYINPGTYTVTLTASNASGTNTIAKTAFITVYDKPRVSFTVNDSSNCIPFTSRFSDLSTTSFGTITAWEWDFDDGTRSNEQNPSHSFTQTRNYNVSLKATNDAGCFNILNKLAYIKAADSLKASFGFSQPVQCKPPETISFTNTTLGPGTLSYSWDFGDNTSSTVSNPAHVYITGGTFSIKLVASNTIGCSDTLYLRDTLTIKNNQTIIESPDTACINKMMSFTNASVPAALATRWVFDDGTSGFGATLSKTWNTAGRHSVTLVSNYGSCSDSVTKNITILEPPVADFVANDSQFCLSPATVNFRDNSLGALYWNWSFGDGDSANTKNPSHIYTADGEYDVRLTVTNAPGCTNTATKYRFVRITTPSVDFDKREGGGCIPYTFRPYPAITSLDSVVSYLWDFGNGHTSTLRYPTEIYTDTGIYKVKLSIVTQSGCRSSVEIDSAVQTGTPPTVDFTFSASQVCPRTDINFTSLAAPATRWQWKFGDGGSSTDEDPAYQYLDSSVYSVQLIAWNKGCSDSIKKNSIITVLPGAARFRPVFNCSNKKEVYFKDSSDAAQSWSWNFGDGNTATVQNPTHSFANYQSYTVSLTTNNNGQCPNTDTITIKIINDTADFAAVKNTGCKGASFSFYNTIAHKDNIAQYIWDFGDGSTDSTSMPDTITHVYENGGTYTVRLKTIDINGCSSTKARTNYIIVAAPRAAFGLNSPGGCTNKTVQFVDSSAGNIVQWYWNFGDNQTSFFTSAPPSLIPHTYTSTGQYFPSLTITDSTGCTDSVMLALPVSISQPVADFTSPNFITCINDRVQFQSNSIGENLSYTWDFGDNTFATGASPIKQYAADGDYTPKLIVTDTFGCTDSVTKQGYIQVRTVNASFTTNDTIGLCIPYHAEFINNSTNANSYIWDFGDGGYSSTPNPNYYYSSAGTFFAKLTARRSNTCYSTDSIRIRINAPSGVLRYQPQNGCAPLQVNFSVTTNDKVSFIWDFNDGTSYISNDSSVNYTYYLPGNFVPRVVLKDSLGCSVPLYSEDTIRLYNTSVNFTAPDPIVCFGESVRFTDSSFSGSPVISRRWDFGDGVSSTEVNPLHQYSTPGNYTVKLTVTTRYGCQDSLVRNNYIKVYNKPDISISGNDPAYCGAATIYFTGSQLNAGNGNITWNWNFGNGNTSAVQNPPAQQFSDTGTYTVQLTASYNEGCADTATTNITIKPVPAIAAGNDTIICAGTPLQLHAGGSGVYTWQPAAFLSCVTCNDPVVTTQNDMYVYLSGRNNEGCEKMDSIFIKVKKPFAISRGNDTAICEGRPAAFNISGAEKYVWTPSEGLSNAFIGNPVASPTVTTTYKVVASDDHNCFKDSAEITVKVFQQPFVNAGDDIILNTANPVTLAPVYSGDITSYTWSPVVELSCYDCPNPIVSPKKNTTYKIEVSNAGGCKASDEITIFVKCDASSISIPTAFSPNNDGRNDKFGPLGTGNIMISSFKVFNRFGQLIFLNGNFRLDDKSGGWDGKFKGVDQPAGNYVYSIEFVCANNDVSVMNGSIMLVR